MMDVAFKQETLTMREMKSNQIVALMVEGDMIVPDVKPDIGEVLLAEANAVITGQEHHENQLRVTGTTTVKILYMPEGEDQPKCIETKLDFKETVEVPAEGEIDLRVRVDTERIEFTMIHSRKLNLKIVLSLCTRGYQKRELTVLQEVEESCSLKIRYKHLPLYQVVADTARDITITENLEVPSVKPDIDEIIKLGVKAVKGECKIIPGKILLKGILCITTLYRGITEENGIETMEHELPFSEVLDVEGLDEECLCNVSYGIKDVFYSVHNDMNGDPRVVGLDVVMRADIFASRSREIKVIDDCYTTKGMAEVQWETVDFEEVLCEGTSHENLKHILTVPAEMPHVDAIYSLQCKPRILEKQVREGELHIRGKVTVFVLYGCGAGKLPLYSLIEEFDFTHSLPIEGLDGQSLCECSVSDQNVSFTLNAASEIELRCILEFYSRAVRKEQCQLVSACQVEEGTEQEERGLVIYFACPGDNLWDVAKHYKTDQDRIVSLNKMEQTQLQPGQKILIPRGNN